MSKPELVKLVKNLMKKEESVQVFHQSLPACIDDWAEMEPQFVSVPGWMTPTSACDSFASLPTETKSFIRQMEQISKKKIRYLSVNDDSEEGILRI